MIKKIILTLFIVIFPLFTFAEINKDDENKLKILEGYNNYVEEMEKKFENA